MHGFVSARHGAAGDPPVKFILDTVSIIILIIHSQLMNPRIHGCSHTANQADKSERDP